MKKLMKMTMFMLALSGFILGGVQITAAAGSKTALEDQNLTLEEMLEYALEDERMAQTEYEKIIDTFGQVNPFVNIIEAEKIHEQLVLSLYESQGIEVPGNNEESMVIPESLEEAYRFGIQAEESNIAMYELFLKEDLDQDVRDTFEFLKEASQRHLAAFTRALENSGSSLGSGWGYENNKDNTASTANTANRQDLNSQQGQRKGRNH